jgi:hypothetical protein
MSEAVKKKLARPLSDFVGRRTGRKKTPASAESPDSTLTGFPNAPRH